MDQNSKQNTCENKNLNIKGLKKLKKDQFVCSFDGCSKRYRKSWHLKRHEDTHGPGYRCSDENCQQYFKSKWNLKRHVDNIHLKKKPKTYKCSICDEEFNKHNWLTSHMFKHTGVKPYECPKEGCKKSFNLPSRLKRHLKIHDGYVCSKENCGQKFPTWTVYVKHVKTSHPTIHRCQYCEKIFTTSNNLKSHLECHKLDNREVYLCPKPNCSRYYTKKKNLTHHLKAYHEKRPFLCTTEHCFKAFKSEEDLSNHISLHSKKRVRKKKKGRPNFASKLAGLVPGECESEDEASEEKIADSEEEIEIRVVYDTSLEDNKQNELNSNCMCDNASICDIGDDITMKTMLERKSYNVESIICISA